jgi:hypothetical protein
MLPLLVWIAGCALGLWTIWHFGYWRELIGFALCFAWATWVLGGARWIGQKLQAGAAARAGGASQVPPGPQSS